MVITIVYDSSFIKLRIFFKVFFEFLESFYHVPSV